MEKPDAETLKLLATLKKTNNPSEKLSIIKQLMESNKVLPQVKECLAKLLEEDTKPPLKTREDFMKEVILYQNAKKLSPDLTPEQRAEEVEKILNDPKTRQRVIFSHWPRPAPGTTKAYITPDNTLPGKTAPNGLQLWGATLFDFYRVQRMPEVPNLSTITTGSKMAAWCKANGEGDFPPAKSMIEWVDEEEEPKIIDPCDVAQLVRDGEALVDHKTWNKDTEKESEEGKDADMWKLPEEWPPKSIFDAAAYPKPWPSIPFSDDWLSQSLPTFQHYIPQSRLPKRLVVHDPWNLLHVYEPYHDEDWAKDVQIPWSEKKDIIYTYKLKLSEKNIDRKKKEDEEISKEDARAKKVLETFLADPHSRNELPPGLEIRYEQSPGPARPPIYVIFPPEPRLASAEEAHLYLSPSQTIGKGNHSFVYFAEFEVPRSFIVKEKLCTECIMADVADILKQEEFKDPKWEEKSGRISVKEVIKHPKIMTVEGKDDQYLLEEGYWEESLEYDGPYRVVHSRVKYQNLEREQYCEHFKKNANMIHPLTTKVRVAAKLSIEHDPHLRREAENYQAFPQHFFQHWSGYNIIQPLHDPVPVAPIVPQFYGYYVVDEEEEKNKADAMDTTSDTCSSSGRSSRSSSRQTYLSPILLMEQCGTPINPNNLNGDDKSECASLVHRFNEAAWFHGSIAQRNILIQAGPLSAWPAERVLNGQARGGHGVNWSFRLIDFGRSMYVGGDEPGINMGCLRDEQNQVTSWFNGWKGL